MTVVTTPPSNTQPGFSLIAGGYIAAVLIASLAGMTALTMVYGEGLEFLSAFPGWCVLTLIFALPGFIVIVSIARYFRLRGWVFFTIAGGLDSIMILGFLYLLPFIDLLRNYEFTLTVLAGGLVTGFVYWLIAYPQRGASA